MQSTAIDSWHAMLGALYSRIIGLGRTSGREGEDGNPPRRNPVYLERSAIHRVIASNATGEMVSSMRWYSLIAPVSLSWNM